MPVAKPKPMENIIATTTMMTKPMRTTSNMGLPA